VNLMFPASAVTGPPPAALAMPAALTAIRPTRAIVNIRYLRISLCLSFGPARPWASAIGRLSLNFYSAGQTTTRHLFVNPSMREKERLLAESGVLRLALDPLQLSGGAIGAKERKRDPKTRSGSRLGSQATTRPAPGAGLEKRPATPGSRARR